VLFISIHADPRNEYPFYLGHADETAKARAGLQPESAAAGRQQRRSWFGAGNGLHPHRQLRTGRAGGVAGGGYLPRSTVALSRCKRRLPARGERLAKPTAFIFEGGYAVKNWAPM
jgi:hypothetical protein